MQFKLFIICLSLALCSCSVYKAASNEGVTVGDISRCQSKAALTSLGMEVKQSYVNEEGNFVVIYSKKARETGGNVVRALAHGVLDVSTLGLWEVVATPVEWALSNNLGYITAKVTYASENQQDSIIAMEVFDGSGATVIKR